MKIIMKNLSQHALRMYSSMKNVSKKSAFIEDKIDSKKKKKKKYWRDTRRIIDRLGWKNIEDVRKA